MPGSVGMCVPLCGVPVVGTPPPAANVSSPSNYKRNNRVAVARTVVRKNIKKNPMPLAARKSSTRLNRHSDPGRHLGPNLIINYSTVVDRVVVVVIFNRPLSNEPFSSPSISSENLKKNKQERTILSRSNKIKSINDGNDVRF